MVRGFGILAVVALLLVAAGFWVVCMGALGVTIGSGPVALVQNPVIVKTVTAAGGGPVAATLTSPSSAGTALILAISQASGTGTGIVTLPAGWVLLGSATEPTFASAQLWFYVYQNNPGAISSVAITTNISAFWFTEISEWTNVFNVSTVDVSGTATAVGGTTLTPSTTGGVTLTGDLAITGWIQRLGAPATVTFTTPAGWNRLADWGATSENEHMDLEYQINPTPGILSPKLISTGTTISAAGVTIALNGGRPVADVTAYLEYDSLTIKNAAVDISLVKRYAGPDRDDLGPAQTASAAGIVRADSAADLALKGGSEPLIEACANRLHLKVRPLRLPELRPELANGRPDLGR